MFQKQSRYKNVLKFVFDTEKDNAFNGYRTRDFISPVGVIEHTVKQGDRLDLLALYYYNNDRMWWRIVDANPQFIYSGNMINKNMIGDVIVIPKK